jgi:hypothetical protein
MIDLPDNVTYYTNKDGEQFEYNKMKDGKRINIKYKLKSKDYPLELNNFIDKIKSKVENIKIDKPNITLKNICGYYNIEGIKCKNHTNKNYCGIHCIYEDKVEPKNISFCDSCKKIIIRKSMNTKICENCYNIRKCKGITRDNKNCKYMASELNDYCDKHQSYYKWKTLVDSGKIICNNWIRGCWNNVNIHGICSDCTEEDKNKIITKEDLIVKATEFNIKNTEYKMCINCGIVVDINIFNINDMCKNCNKLSKVNVDNYKEKDLFDKQYKIYIYNAEQRKLKFNLTKIEAIKLFSKKCYYCNVKNDVNGIDRMNNNIDYVKSNCVACCTTCNFMKGVLDSNTFIKLCEHIATYNKSIDGKLNYELFSSNKNPKYETYRNGATERNLKFTLSEEEFYNIILQKCFYCGVYNKTKIGKCAGGIDRKDSNLDYTIDNCVPCCTTCNFMKGVLNNNMFLKQCINIAKVHTNDISENLEEKLLDEFYDLINYEPKRIKPKFLHSKDYYDKRIWAGNIEDLKKVKIALEFVENKEQHDIWNYYRYTVSSLNIFTKKGLVGRTLCILVKDLNTSKYLGIMSLSSDIANLQSRDNYIGWTSFDRFDNHRLNQVMNLSTCVGLQPFAFNYNGGKLLVKLAFSKEVMDKFYEKYNEQLLGIITTGLYGKSIQYDRLKELKFIGYTSGNSVYKIPPHITKLCREYLLTYHNKNCSNMDKLHVISNTLQKLGLSRELFMSDNPKGVYFGYTHPKSKEVLCNKIKTKLPDIAMPCADIFNDWYNRWAVQRYNHLNKIKNFKDFHYNISSERVTKYRNKMKESMGIAQYKNMIKEQNHKYYEKTKEPVQNNKIKESIKINNQEIEKPDLPNNISIYKEKDDNFYIQYSKTIQGERNITKHKITSLDIQKELNKLIISVNKKFPEQHFNEYTIKNPELWNNNNVIKQLIKIENDTKPDMPNNFSICTVNGTDYIQFCKKIDDKKHQYKTRINSYDLQSELNRFVDYLNETYKFATVLTKENVTTNGWRTTNNIICHDDTPEKLASRARANNYNMKKKEELGEEKYKEMLRNRAFRYRDKKEIVL